MTTRKKASSFSPGGLLSARKAGLILFSGVNDLGSHWARIVAQEKDVDGLVVEWVLPEQGNEDWMVLSPDHILPTLADREVVLYPARLIVEYMDERYPHPPMLPVEPSARARVRMILSQIETRFYPLAQDLIDNANGNEAKRVQLRDQLLTLSAYFPQRNYFFGNDVSTVDCAWAALLWRLPSLGIPLSSIANLKSYAERLFARRAFSRSLSEQERQLAS